MSFPFVPKSVTSNDLERSNGVILRYFSEFGHLPGALHESSRSQSHLLMSSCPLRLLHAFLLSVRLLSSPTDDLVDWNSDVSVCPSVLIRPQKVFFYTAPQCSHCKSCCTSYGNSVRLSVRPSVCLATRRYCVKTTAHNTVQCALCGSKM